MACQAIDILRPATAFLGWLYGWCNLVCGAGIELDAGAGLLPMCLCMLDFTVIAAL